jgi:hypothetical protein
MTNVHDFTLNTLDGGARSLGDFKGQALLLVNVASECGLTPQYAGLQALHAELEGQGFSVLGFPCNQFGAQEPGTAAQIQTFCTKNYGVTFPLFAKLEVNGPGPRAPLRAPHPAGHPAGRPRRYRLELREVPGGERRAGPGPLLPPHPPGPPPALRAAIQAALA